MKEVKMMLKKIITYYKIFDWKEHFLFVGILMRMIAVTEQKTNLNFCHLVT